MIPLLLEGFESALLPCSLVLLIPGAAVAVAARQESTPALIGYGLAVAAMSWLRLSGRVDDLSRLLVALAFGLAVVLLLVPIVRRLDAVAGLGGAMAGLGAASLWEPCVGAEFGTLLGQLPDRGASGFLLLAVYLAGVLAPVVLLGSVLHLVPNPSLLPVRPVMMAAGGGVIAILALATAAGLSDELVSQLVEWSL